LIDWCLTPTLTVFHRYRGVTQEYFRNWSSNHFKYGSNCLFLKKYYQDVVFLKKTFVKKRKPVSFGNTIYMILRLKWFFPCDYYVWIRLR